LASGATAAFAAADAFTADLTGTGQQNVITGGWHSSGALVNSSNYRDSVLSVFGWRNGQLVDQTSQWFSPGNNIISGGTSSLKFGNFNGASSASMFVTPFTDGNKDVTQLSIFTNDGSKFTRRNINLGYSINSADSTLFKYDNLDAIISLDYGSNTTFVLPSRTNNFKAYSVKTGSFSGSSIAAGDFLGNGSQTFVITDNGLNAVDKSTTKLFGWNYDSTTDTVSMSYLSTLPAPTFNKSAYWAGSGGNNTNKAVTFDFDGSGVPSIFLVSMPIGGLGRQYNSSIQFLKNNGTGTFTDVTDTTVTGYNMALPATNNPVVIDLLNNGLPSIVLPSIGGTQVLMQVSKGKYVASLSTVIDNFSASASQLAGVGSGPGTVTFVRGPNNNLYLLDLIPLSDDINNNSTSIKGLYLTQVTGTTVATSAKQAISLAKTMWPYLTDQNLATIIGSTGMSYNGATILDVNALLSPSGTLGLPVNGRIVPINGWISGLGPYSTDATAMDSLGRSWKVDLSAMQRKVGTAFDYNTEHIDQYELTSHAEYLINGTVTTVPTVMGFSLRGGAEGRTPYNTIGGKEDQGYSLLTKPRQYTMGIPDYYKNGSWSMGMQYSNLNYNPWIGFAGAWGEVTNSTVFDHVISYHKQGFVAKASVMYVTTSINPGMITNVSPMTGGWAEAGYRYNSNERFGDLGFYVGVKPVVFSGSVEAKLPTGIDNAGNINYTSQTLGVKSDVTGYARLLYNKPIDKRTQYRLSGTALTNGQFRVMNELKFFLD
jgi:hypothetical protein